MRLTNILASCLLMFVNNPTSIFKICMLKTFYIFLISLCFVQLLSAQTFEGIVETRQVGANGVSNDISWYIKKDRIAFELRSNANPAGMKMRFVPQSKQNSLLLVVTTSEGENKSEINANDINSEIDMSRGEVKENGVKNSAEYGELTLLIINTPTTVTETEVSKLIDVNFSKYASFFKNDYAVQGLIRSGQSGFPLNSVTKDKSGKVITKTTVISIRKIPVSESYFK
jgi:hypothetical protein